MREKPKGSGVWWIFIHHKGRRFSKRVGDKAVALKAAEGLQARLTLEPEFKIKTRSNEVPFREYGAQWLEFYVKPRLKASTVRNYRAILKGVLNPKFGTRPLSSISREELRNFFLGQFQKTGKGGTRAASTVKQYHAVMSGILRLAVEDGHVEANAAADVRRYLKRKDDALGKEISPLDAKELELYLQVCREEYPGHYPLFLTLARTGMRLGEVLGLQWGDVDFAGGFIEVKRGWVEGKLTTPKTGKIRRVIMSPQLQEVLEGLRLDTMKRRLQGAADPERRKGPEWIFSNGQGMPMDPKNLRERYHKRICEKAKLRQIRIHDLRHSYATIRISAGHNIADVSRQLGHSSIKMTVDVYARFLPNEKKGEVEELDHLGHETAKGPHPRRTQALGKGDSLGVGKDRRGGV